MTEERAVHWYWIALILGIAAPWIVIGREIRIGFEEGGLKLGLGVWGGMCLLTIPAVFLIMGLGHFLIA